MKTKDFEKWAADMLGSGVLETGLPAEARDEKDEVKRDRLFTLLFATSSPGGNGRRTYYSNPEKLDEEKQERFQEVLNGILKHQEKTYSVYADED